MSKQDLYGLCLKCNTYHTSGDPCDYDPKLHTDMGTPRRYYYSQKQMDEIKTQRNLLRDALSMIIDLAHDYTIDYGEKWGAYRSDIQMNIQSRVAHARNVLTITEQERESE